MAAAPATRISAGETAPSGVAPRLYLLLHPRPDEHSTPTSIPGDDAVRTWLKRELTLLDRPLSPDERETIATLQDIWQDRFVERTWGDLQFAVDADQARQILDTCTGNTVIGLGLEGRGGILRLFGREIALGHERLLFLQVSLANQSAVRQTLGRRARDTAIPLRFVPGENRVVEGTYSDLPQLRELADATAGIESATMAVTRDRDMPDYRPGRWLIYTSPPLHAPIELPPQPEVIPSGWRLDISDRVRAKFEQLDREERAAVLALLWGIQRRGGRAFLERRAARAGAGDAPLYIINPTADLRIILRALAEDTLEVAEVVYTETLTMFRER